MLEMRVTGPGEARLLSDGSPIGSARWTICALSWGRERVKVAQVTQLQVPPDCRADLWAYLTFLFQRDGVAAAMLDGVLFWFSHALEESWRAAGRPMELQGQEEDRP